MGVKVWKLQWEQFCADQVLLSRTFHSRPGCRQKILSKEFWGWGSKFDPQLRRVKACDLETDTCLSKCAIWNHQRFGDFLQAFVDSTSLRFSRVCKIAFKLSHSVNCRHCLRFGVRDQNASISRFSCGDLVHTRVLAQTSFSGFFLFV